MVNSCAVAVTQQSSLDLPGVQLYNLPYVLSVELDCCIHAMFRKISFFKSALPSMIC